MGRPRGAVQLLVLERLAGAPPMTAREIAHAVQISVPRATETLHRLVQAVVLVELDRVTVEWMKRPAARYQLPTQSPTESAWAALARWPTQEPHREVTCSTEKG